MSKAILSWNEICRQYPNQAVALTDYTLKMLQLLAAQGYYTQNEKTI